MLKVEYLIYFYIILCILMIFFNYFYMLHRSRKDTKIQKGSQKLIKYVEGEINSVIVMNQTTDKNIRYLIRKLKNIDNLYILEEILDKYDERIVDMYIKENEITFFELCKYYRKKDVIARSYFAYFIGKFGIGKDNSEVVDYLFSLLKDDEIYCIDNVLQALYRFGNVERVVKAIRIIDSKSSYENINMILKGLEAYSGDKEVLIEHFLRNFNDFSEKIKIVIIRYMTTVASNRWNDYLYSLTREAKLKKSLKIAIINYFAIHYDERIKEILFKILKLPVTNNKEYIKASVCALKLYPGDDTIRELKKVLQINEWELQIEAAKVLDFLVPNYIKLADIYNSENKNARQILKYINSRKKMNSKVLIRG